MDEVSAGYRKKEVLHGVSLAAQAGQIVALLGSNGAGKSTLLNVIIGLLRPWRGAVWLGDRDITALPPHQRARDGVAFVNQGGGVFPSLTVRENLEMGIRASRSGRAGADSVERALEQFPALKDHLRSRAGLLSGGQRQMLALAMRLAQQPRILLLDEPSAGLAPDLARGVMEKVRELNQACGLTVLIAEQRVREVLSIATSAVVMVNGSIAAETSAPADWTRNGALDEYFLGRQQSQNKPEKEEN